MTFSIYLPFSSDDGATFPVLYYLSGLTCTDSTAQMKSGLQRYAAQHGIIIVTPDTSPRGIEPIKGQETSWDFGQGAGFYIDAITPSFKDHYNMYSYITKVSIILSKNIDTPLM